MNTPGNWDQLPNDALGKILYAHLSSSEIDETLELLLAIDAAHVAMLCSEKLLPYSRAQALLKANRIMHAAHQAGDTVVDTGLLSRGVYYAYERALSAQLGGEDGGGTGHLARSRNDINATVVRMRLRRRVLDFASEATRAQEVIAEMARQHADTLFCSFSHRQPGQPSTFGHYLSAVGIELSQCLDALRDQYAALNVCPMGACAGAGTSIPIDSHKVAHLLGFEAPIENALFAVASRSFAARLLASLAIWSTTLTRIASDLQNLSSYPLNFLFLPDNLVSTSSIMPQKRNAYVYEHVRGQASAVSGCLNSMLLQQKSAPFANDIEAGTEAVAHCFKGFEHAATATALIRLLIGASSVREEAMASVNANALTGMSGLADFLAVRCAVPFREAHAAVADALRVVADKGITGIDAVVEVLRRHFLPAASIDYSELAMAARPEQQISLLLHGGGAASVTVLQQVAKLQTALAEQKSYFSFQRESLAKAEAALGKAIATVCSYTEDT